MYYDLKDTILRAFGLNISDEAEDYLMMIDEQVKAHTSLLKSYKNTKPHDFIRSLVLLRGYDIALTRRDILNSEAEEVHVEKSDIQFSILTMPCDCPVNYWCCLNIVNGSIGYILVFPQDFSFFGAQDTFYDMDSALNHKDFLSRITDRINDKKNNDEEFYRKILNSYSQKIDIWRLAVRQVAIPLAEIYKSSNIQ